MKTVDLDFVRELYPKRDEWAHKGDSGRVLIIGGSRRYRGAPALAGLAALRAGADIVTIAAPESAADIISGFSPNLITEPLEGDFLNPRDVQKALTLSKKFDSVILGPGIGRMSPTKEFVIRFLKEVAKPCVIDADAIHLVSEHKNALRKGFVVTPHAGEFYSLSGTEVGKNVKERGILASKFSREFGCCILLKGHVDVIAEGRNVIFNSTGNPYMTVGGTGDVLSGICGAMLAMGMKPFQAAAAAAYVSGRAGDLAADILGPGLVATDVIERIPKILKMVLG